MIEIPIQINSDIPIYQQIYSIFKKEILSNNIKDGEQLPSIRNLAKSLNISTITVVSAYRKLVNDGLVVSFSGKGYVVNSIDKEQIQKQQLCHLEQKLQEVFEFAKDTNISIDEMIEILKKLDKQS